jgi:hypothetical protein
LFKKPAIGHDFTEDESDLVEMRLNKFEKPSVPLGKVLMDREDLQNHPLLDPQFISKGCRQVAFARCNDQFAELYAESKLHAPRRLPPFVHHAVVLVCVRLAGLR